MAFRASTKSAKTKKTVPEAKPAEEPASTQRGEPIVAPSLSIDELVGGPKPSFAKASAGKEEPKAVEPAPLPYTPARNASHSDAGGPPARQDRPRMGFDRNRGGYTPGRYRRPMGSPRYSSGSPRFGEAGEAGGGYQNRGAMPAGRQGFSGGYRREWVPRAQNGDPPSGRFTPDIDVPTETVRGILDIMPDGHGFLRPKFTPSERDVYISQSQIRRFLLRNGDMVEGQARAPKDNERYYGLLKVEKVDDKPAEEMASRPKFEDLTPLYPNKHLKLETGQQPLSTRILDLIAPIGFGQRGLIVSPPKAGKTTILKELAAGIAANYPQAHLMAALIGERPEEVTDLTRSIKGEVLASNFDESPSEQTRIAEVALDRAKRLVEMGKDVVILLDSITRLARAYNLVVNPSGRTLSGGFDPAALYPAKKFLGAARCVEGAEGKTAGSLTVIGTALIETGSRMDDLIYEEFKGTGNMELHLSRALQERRIFPAIDIGKSGTRHDELLIGEEQMKKVTTLRHMLSMLGDEERTMMLIEKLGKTKDNAEFLDTLSQG
jgi:transcription termination factor Rho